jgi:hypothetical protein
LLTAYAALVEDDIVVDHGQVCVRRRRKNASVQGHGLSPDWHSTGTRRLGHYTYCEPDVCSVLLITPSVLKLPAEFHVTVSGSLNG